MSLATGGGRRWLVAGMLFLAAVLNYVDRTVLSILAPTIQADLGIDDAGYALVVNAFLAAYTISYVLSGRLVDRFGGLVGMALFVGFWSAANAATGFARSVTSLAVARFCLGLGEAGGWTASPKITAGLFAPAERATVIGLYTAGGTVGATLAPILAVWLADRFGWQWAFFGTGLAGLAWLLPWLAIAPRDSLSPAACEAPGTWREVLAQPVVWVLLAARSLTDAVWYFLQFWFPKYLAAERGLAQEDLSRVWLVYLAADVGLVGGGLVSGWLVRRGCGAARARVALMAVSAGLVPAAALVPAAGGPGGVFAVVMVAALGHALWLTNLSALAVDLVPGRILATSFGVIAAGSGLGGMAMNALVASTIERHSYAPCFQAAAVLHPLALGMVCVGLRRSLSATSSSSGT